jgi:hypothetical protein
MKDEGAIDWREGFPNFHWTRRASSRTGLGGVPRRKRNILCFWEKKKEENESVRNILVLMCGRVLFMKKMCANKNMEGSCV